MNRNELDIAIDWAALEGWNPGLHDAECFHAADPSGFLIGKLDGEPIATISVVKYNESFGFLGFYIVKPEYRGKGYGIKIWNAGLKYLKGCNIGLDGVVEQQENYKKSGFQLAYRNIRYEGISGGQFPKNINLINLSSVSFKSINNYDRDFFPAARAQFLKYWLKQSDSKSLGIFHDGRLSGYGVIRPCRKGYKIGPLFANCPQLANSLFNALKVSVSSSQPVFLDVPEVNQDAINLAKNNNMQVVFETARMYTQESPKLSLNRLYGVTTFELG